MRNNFCYYVLYSSLDAESNSSSVLHGENENLCFHALCITPTLLHNYSLILSFPLTEEDEVLPALTWQR
jgi:hypothetical protein